MLVLFGLNQNLLLVCISCSFFRIVFSSFDIDFYFSYRKRERLAFSFILLFTPAGVRNEQLIENFLELNFQVFYSSPSSENEYTKILKERGIETFFCLPNFEEKFADILKAVKPDVCLFDRFIMEVSFSSLSHSLHQNNNNHDEVMTG